MSNSASAVANHCSGPFGAGVAKSTRADNRRGIFMQIR